MIQRAMSMAADAGEPPGRMKTLGIWKSCSKESMVFSRFSTISSVTGRKCSWNNSYLSGSVASSAAMVNRSRCNSRRVSCTRSSDVKALASPIADTASSVIP